MNRRLSVVRPEAARRSPSRRPFAEPEGSVPYAELHVHSAYSFLDGASLPADLVARACELELQALAVTDHGGFPGVVQLASAARAAGLPAVIGTELTLLSEDRSAQADPPGEHIVLLARDPEGYRRLSRTVGEAMLASGEKNRARYELEDLAAASGGNWMVLSGCRKGGVRRALEGLKGQGAEGPRGGFRLEGAGSRGRADGRIADGFGIAGSSAIAGGRRHGGFNPGASASSGPSPALWDVDAAVERVRRLESLFGKGNVAVELTNSGAPLDRERCRALVETAKRAGVPYLATGNVHYARPRDRDVADVFAATRARTTLEEIDPFLPANGSHLRSGAQMLSLHRDHPEAVAEAARIGAECAFDLALVAPNLPDFPVPEGHTEASWLRCVTRERALERYGPRSSNPRAWEVIDHELDVIVGLGFPGYFLIVCEIVDFCRSRGIWCQGRGSSANSAVCFALGITAVDAVRHKMLFERFLFPGRSGPPDIDVDIESDRREEVIQHVYERYGRKCAAQVANTISYRPRSAIRDAAKALGYEEGQVEAWLRSVEHKVPAKADASGSAGYEPAGYEADVPAAVADLASRMHRLPRHLGIHTGGMVLCDRPVIDVCPAGWARMPGRTVLQWDKDDCAEAGLVKFDLLGLGMLTALRKSYTQLTDAGIAGSDGKPLGLHNLPQEDPRVYALLQAADTVGVFQVESRAQMATLPRLRPECFYDIVIEVALIRPGPIQGDAVSPYLARRRGREPVTYPHPLTKPALEKTLGVPLFQEQLMQIAIDVAGFTPAQADRLRKAMGAKRSHERMSELKSELYSGMAAKGVPSGVREEIYDKLDAFAEFGFPESHSFSFAYLVYASAWLKVHFPEHFYAGILAAQPMGFYSPQSLVADARRHGVHVASPCVVSSSGEASVRKRDAAECDAAKHGGAKGDGERGETECDESKRSDGAAASARLVDPHGDLEVCLGLDSVRRLGAAAASRILEARRDAPFADAADMARRARLGRGQLEALAAAGALRALGMGRREGIWAAQALADKTVQGKGWYQPALPGTESIGPAPALGEMTEQEAAIADISSTGVSAGSYPTQFLRGELAGRGILKISDLGEAPVGKRVRVAGVVTHRQRPWTATGVTFISLEDETGILNVVCSTGLWDRYRHVARRSQGLVVRGMVERGDDAMNFVADALEPLALPVQAKSRDFR